MVVDGQLHIERISSTECLKDFHCGIESMDNFIHGQFRLSIDNNFCKAYIVKNQTNDILAMFALSFDSIDLDSDDRDELQNGLSSAGTPLLDNDYEETFYSKRRYPALDIAYLAVATVAQHQGLGVSIIDIIAEKAEQQDFAGCMFLSVEALATKDYSAVDFYNKCGFAPNEYPNPSKDTLRMFKTLKVDKHSNNY